jgi:hypothetical protein
MNVQDIATRIRRTFGDEAAVQIVDADIIRWINDGQVEIIINNDTVLEKTSFVDLVVNQQEYALPVDLLILRSVRFKYADMLSYSHLKYLNMQQFDEAINGWDGTAFGSSAPYYFTKYEGKIVLFPTPDQANVNGLKILYNQKPTDVDDLADPISLPLLYHNTLVKYCMWQASLLEEDYEPSIMYQTNFKDGVDNLSNRENTDPTEKYSTITVLSEDLW